MIEPHKLTPMRLLHAIAIRSGLRNALNRKKFGPDAPETAMHFTIKPNNIQLRYVEKENGGKKIHHWQSGQIIGGEWDLCTTAFKTSVKFSSCRRHFMKGVPWTETRAWTYGLRRIDQLGKYDACKTETDLANRYAKLDELWLKVTTTGALPASTHSDTTSRTGILVHIDRNGKMLFGNQGFHRLAIAKLAKISKIVVVVGIIHPDALKTEAYKALMMKRVI